jgi:hypothetical protein
MASRSLEETLADYRTRLEALERRLQPTPNLSNFVDAGTVTAALAAKAPLNSPALTGIPTAPTAALGSSGANSSQLATTAFATAASAAAAAAATPQATTDLKGIAEFAVAAEIITGTDATKALSVTEFTAAWPQLIRKLGSTITVFSPTDLTALYSLVPGGTLVRMGYFAISSGSSAHYESFWVKDERSSSFIPVPGTAIQFDGGDQYTLMQTANAFFTQFQAIGGTKFGWNSGQLAIDVAQHVVRWDGNSNFVPQPGVLLRKEWAQWAFGPAPRAGWWDPPIDTFWDPWQIANYGNGMTLPATGRYRAFGRWGYQQSTGNDDDRCIAAVTRDDNQEWWAGLPHMIGGTGFPFTIYFEGVKGQKVKFRAYHANQSDYYMTPGANNNTASPATSQVLWEYLGV